MQRTHLPLLVWIQAIYLIAASSKGISADMLGVSCALECYLQGRVGSISRPLT